MTKADLINAVAEQAQLQKKDAEKAVAAVIDAITAALVDGDKVALVGFGTFETKTRSARVGINPVTKQPMDIPESIVPSFKAGKALKDAVSNR